MTPLINFFPRRRSTIRSWPLRRFHLFSADCISLYTITRHAWRVPLPLVRSCLRRTVANVDSIMPTRHIKLICVEGGNRRFCRGSEAHCSPVFGLVYLVGMLCVLQIVLYSALKNVRCNTDSYPSKAELKPPQVSVCWCFRLCFRRRCGYTIRRCGELLIRWKGARTHCTSL